MDLKEELQQIIRWRGQIEGRRSAQELVALAGAALAEIERLERFGVRMLIVHEHHPDQMAKKLIKVVDCLTEGDIDGDQ